MSNTTTSSVDINNLNVGLLLLFISDIILVISLVTYDLVFLPLTIPKMTFMILNFKFTLATSVSLVSLFLLALFNILYLISSIFIKKGFKGGIGKSGGTSLFLSSIFFLIFLASTFVLLGTLSFSSSFNQSELSLNLDLFVLSLVGSLVFSFFGNIFLGKGLYNLGSQIKNGGVKVGSVLIAIQLILLGSIIAYGSLIAVNKTTSSKPINVQGIIRSDGYAILTVYSNVQGVIFSANLSELNVTAKSIFPNVILPGYNQINLQFDGIKIEQGKIYNIIISIVSFNQMINMNLQVQGI